MARLLRGALMHTPRDPFQGGALEVWPDGGLLLEGGRVRALDDFAALRAAHPDAEVRDLRGGLLLPGFVDLHVHYPQVRLLGGLGLTLFDWLERHTLPFEARLADAALARQLAREFLRGCLQNGTTTAMVFGAHFAGAVDVFFEEAAAIGFRATSGLVVSDRFLRPELHTTPERAAAESLALAARWHGHGKLRYAVMPRFAYSCSEAVLDACGAVLQERPELSFHTHLNEVMQEPELLRGLFPWSADPLGVYERSGLLTGRSVFAHNICPTDSELARLAGAGAAVAHCPCSHGYTGAGSFPMRRHLAAGVRFGLGSDVAGGTGFSLVGEGLEAYKMQHLRPDGVPLTPAHLLHLATRAGALALGLDAEVGDFTPGKAADVVWLRPRPGSSFEVAFSHAPDAERALAVAFTMATEADVAEVFVDGEPMSGRLAEMLPEGSAGPGAGAWV